MKMRVAETIRHLNLDVMRVAFEKMEGDQIIEFSHEYGEGMLFWRRTLGGKYYAISALIPRQWLDSSDGASEVESIARGFAECISGNGESTGSTG